MKLYIFNETRRGAAYGVGTYITELSTALKGSYLSVCIINLMSDKQKMQVEEIDGVRYWYFPAPVTEKRTIDIEKQEELYYRNIVYLLQLHIEDKKNLMFHLNYNHFNKLSEELKNVFECKIVLVVHYLESCMTLFGNISRLRRIISQPEEPIDYEERMAKMFYLKEKVFFQSHAVDKIICLSNHASDLLHQDFLVDKEKIVIVYNGLMDSNLALDKHTLRQRYHIPDIPIILFVGRLDEIKGLSYVLRAFRVVLKKHPHCQIIIAGNGSFDDYMKECEDIWMRVTWTGLINKEKLYNLYSIADIGIMPSLFEPFGYVAVEMMMHELPIVATSTSGLNEVIDDNCGLKIPVIEYPDRVDIDSSLLAEKILYLLQHPIDARQLGQNGRKRYLEKFSSEIFSRNMLQVYCSTSV